MAATESSSSSSGSGLMCQRCSRQFEFRDLFVQHQVSCEYISSESTFCKHRTCHRTKKRERDDTDAWDQANQLTRQQCLATRVEELERDVSDLRQRDALRRRQGIASWLKHPMCPRPSVTFGGWIATALQVETWHVERLDAHSLVEVFQDMLENALLLRGGSSEVLPMCAFAAAASSAERPMFVWDWEDTERAAAQGFQPIWLNLTVVRWDCFFAQLQHQFRKVLSGMMVKDVDGCCRQALDQDLRDRLWERMRYINFSVRDADKKTLRRWLGKQLEKRNPAASV